METKEKKDIVSTALINKTVPMDSAMITKIHKLMKIHLEEKDRPISFGEAARRMIKAGLEQQEKTG